MTSRNALLAAGLAALVLAPLSPHAQASALQYGPLESGPRATPTEPAEPTEEPTDTAEPTDTTEPTEPTETATGEPTESPTGEGTASPTAGAGQPFGPGCASLPQSGPGSLSSLSGKTAGAAIAESPQLASLAKAVKAAGLADRLDTAESVTVFAPSDTAFSQVPRDQLEKLMSDKAQLQKLLSYHVVEGQTTKEDLTSGPLTTLQGGDLTVKGADDAYTVNDQAKITCGQIPVKNGVVYIIDKVLTPQ